MNRTSATQSSAWDEVFDPQGGLTFAKIATPKAAMVYARLWKTTVNCEQETRKLSSGLCAGMCLPNGHPLPVSIIDVARGDLRILTDRPLRFGTRTNIVFFCRDLTNTTPNTGIVHWCRPAESGWEMGLFLNSPIPESMVSGSWWELRDSIRYPCRWQAWIIDQPSASRRPITITDYSLGGIGFECPYRLTVGTQIQISQSPHPSVPAYVLGRVERVIGGGGYGCFLPREGGRFLPGMFNASQTLHMESPFVDGLRIRSSLLPQMIEKLPVGGFDAT